MRSPPGEHRSVNEDVEQLIEGMRRCGFSHAVAVDLTNPKVKIPVARVVVPQAEAWPMFCSDTGRSVLGRRALHAVMGSD